MTNGNQFTYNASNFTVTIKNPSSTLISFTYLIAGIQNPPYTIQVSDFNVITSIPAETLGTGTQFVTYTPGILQSCEWAFSQFTGSSNSTVQINIVLNDALISSNISFTIAFPNYTDSDNEYLTKNSTISVQYSLNGSALTSATALYYDFSQISFNVTSTGLVMGDTVLIVVSGVQNPPTQTTVGTNFIVSTYQLYDSLMLATDQSNGCTIDSLPVQQYNGSYVTFDRDMMLQINSNYPSPKV